MLIEEIKPDILLNSQYQQRNIWKLNYVICDQTKVHTFPSEFICWYKINLIGCFSTVFDVVQSPLCLVPPPCKFGKILVVDHFVEKNYIEIFRIRNYFKKDFLNFSFHYVRYCNHLVTFLGKFPHQFAFFSSSQWS